ncbi:MAG: SRPBCC domain-containing protein [Thermoanaerobaculia bacterium]|nr:SRPBCC domain-containing protein [Thermoanaerobaculia bacterium]
MSFSAKIQRTIHAPVSKVWAALTQPELVKQYFWGTRLVTSWQPGTPIAFEGEWEGKPYRDKGAVLVFEPEKMLRYDYYSSWSDLEDRPENYQVITYRVKPKGNGTVLTVTQRNIDTLEKKIHSAQNWAALLMALKRLTENP